MQRRISITLIISALAFQASAETLKLANGDTLNGEIVEWAVDHVVIDHPQLGEIRLSLEQLDIDTGKPPPPGILGTRFLRGWNRNIDLGWTGRWGSTNTINITAGLNFNYTDEFTRWRMTVRYFLNRSSDSGDDQDNNARFDLRRDWLFPGHDWFAFASFRYQFDQYEAWRHRTVLSVGPGYNLVRTEAHHLDLRVAPTFTKEYQGSRDSQGELLFGVDYEWTISSRSSFHLANDYYFQWTPALAEFRNLTTGEWRLSLTEEPALSVKIGASNEYDSNPDPGDKANDLRYFVTLGLGF
jgi:putative salt-induced outer membrane protein YdiY